MSDQCLVILAKKGKILDDKVKLGDFVRLWPDLNKFLDKIFAYI